MSHIVLIPHNFTELGRKLLQSQGLQVVEVTDVNNVTLRQYGDQVEGAVVNLSHISNATYDYTPRQSQ